MSAVMKVDYSVTPGQITSNYDSVLLWLGEELDRYDVVVTDETVTESRKMCAELNKMRAALKEIRKDAVAKVSQPIKAFEAQMKALDEMCEEGRQRLLQQIEKFDNEKLAVIQIAICELIEFLYVEKGVTGNYQRVDPSQWVKLSAVTAKGNLTAAVQAEVAAEVDKWLEKQDRYNARVARLESVSELAGLKSPITIGDVSGIIDEPLESAYDTKLNAILSKMRAREAAAIKQMDVMSHNMKADPEVTDSEPTTMTDAPVIPETVKTHNISVACVFKTTAPSHVTDEKIEEKLRATLAKAGLTTLHSVHITRTA